MNAKQQNEKCATVSCSTGEAVAAFDECRKLLNDFHPLKEQWFCFGWKIIPEGKLIRKSQVSGILKSSATLYVSFWLVRLYDS